MSRMFVPVEERRDVLESLLAENDRREGLS